MSCAYEDMLMAIRKNVETNYTKTELPPPNKRNSSDPDYELPTVFSTTLSRTETGKPTTVVPKSTAENATEKASIERNTREKSECKTTHQSVKKDRSDAEEISIDEMTCTVEEDMQEAEEKENAHHHHQNSRINLQLPNIEEETESTNVTPGTTLTLGTTKTQQQTIQDEINKSEATTKTQGSSKQPPHSDRFICTE